MNRVIETMSQHRRYINPPIEEAFCEFRFVPAHDWNLTIPGKLQTELGDEYSGSPVEQRVLGLNLNVQADEPASLQLEEGLAKVQLVTKSGRRQIGVGRDVLSIHMLRPYQDTDDPESSGWREFKPRISKALNAYRKVADPVGVNRIGVRYINKIAVPKDTITVEEYLKCTPPDVTGMPENRTTFVSRAEYVYDDGVILILSQGLLGSQSGSTNLLLDLDVIWKDANPIQLDAALGKAQALRDRERTVFETVITDKAREIFDAD